MVYRAEGRLDRIGCPQTRQVHTRGDSNWRRSISTLTFSEHKVLDPVGDYGRAGSRQLKSVLFRFDLLNPH